MRILRNRKFLLLFLITLILILIPQLFWGKLYIVGGDDSRLYYIFPQQFLDNFVFKISSDNILSTIAGYSSRSFLAPIIFIIFLLKKIPFLNVQFLMYGLNLGLGFLFFYCFLGLFIKNDSSYKFNVKIVASLFYIFSTYLINTLYVNQLLAVYLIFTMPCSLYLFLKGAREEKIALVLLSVLVYSIFSSTFNTVPWSLALFIILIPVFIYFFFEKKIIFLKYGLIFFITFVLLNLHWLLNLFYSYYNNTGSVSALEYYSSGQFKLGSGLLIKQVAGIFSPLNAVFNERDTMIIKNYSFLTLLKGIFFLVIVSAGLFIKKTEHPLKKYYLVSLSSLLLAFFFFSPNFGDWSANVFIFLNDNVPFFSMFRNMYDKFSFALAFSYAFAFAISATVLAEKIKNKKSILVFLIIFLIIIFVNARFFIFQTNNDTKAFNSISGIFKNEFYNLTTYAANIIPGSRFLWLPLNYPSYAYLEDANNKEHFYFGTSPFSILTKKLDYTGYLSFGTGGDPDLGGKIFKAIEEKRYSYVGSTFQKLNINYIIDNREKLPNEAKAFLYSGNMLQIQDKDFRNAILGKEVRNFGNTYVLYEINPDFKSNLFYLANNANDSYVSDMNVKFSQKSNSEYTIILRNIKGKKVLVFQDLYNKGWVLFLSGNKKNIVYQKESNISLHNNFANGWFMDTEKIKKQFGKEFYTENSNGSINITLSLNFYPQKLVYIGSIISLITLLSILLLEILFIVKFFKK